MPPSLYGVTAKRDRAEEHLRLIELRVEDFFKSDPFPMLTEKHPEDGVYRARLVYPKKLPARELSLMIGDCVHNMRSALDYIAWELAGSKMSDMDTMFPIFDTEIGFNTRGKKRIKHLPEDARTLIERLQPFNTRYGGHQLALSAINKVDAADKHKLLTVTIAIAEQVFCNHGVPGYTKAGKYQTGLHVLDGAPLIHNAVIAMFTVSPPIPKMEVDFKFTPQVEFGPIQGFPKHAFIIPNLRIMLDSVNKVIKRFERFFGSSSKNA